MSPVRKTVFAVLLVLTFSAEALSPSQVFEKVKDSVVVVKALDVKGKVIAQGSGVLMPSGKIGTNCHVVKNGTLFHVGGDKQFVPARVWGSDIGKDLCLLEATGLGAKPAQVRNATGLGMVFKTPVKPEWRARGATGTIAA